MDGLHVWHRIYIWVCEDPSSDLSRLSLCTRESIRIVTTHRCRSSQRNEELERDIALCITRREWRYIRGHRWFSSFPCLKLISDTLWEPIYTLAFDASTLNWAASCRNKYPCTMKKFFIIVKQKSRSRLKFQNPHQCRDLERSNPVPIRRNNRPKWRSQSAYSEMAHQQALHGSRSSILMHVRSCVSLKLFIAWSGQVSCPR